ncbi:MAG: hypothetical protein GY786_03455 [Proteobacteria bacterium]|nr:hypothetical protein [Pseudomonadota bacterium]
MSEIFKKSLYIILVLGSFLQTVVAADKQSLFNDAQSTFNRGLEKGGEEKRLLMLRSANLFLSLVKDQENENGYIYYNIGNAYFEAGDKGNAMLYYRRAERFIPGYKDLQYNLGRVREELELLKPGRNWWSDLQQSLFFFHYLIDYDTRGLLFLTLFASFWLVLMVSVFYKNIFILGLQGTLFISFLCLGFSYGLSNYHLQTKLSGVITEQSTTARKGPGRSYQPFFNQDLPGGTEFEIIGDQGDWWKVKLNSEEEVWIDSLSSQRI